MRRKKCNEILAHRIRIAREAKGISRKQLASNLGLSPQAVYYYENGVTEPPVDILIQIGHVVGASASFLLGETDELAPGKILYRGYPLAGAALKQSIAEQSQGAIQDMGANLLKAASVAEVFTRIGEDLKRSSQFYMTLIENSLDAIVLIDQAGAIVYASPAVERILGYSPLDLTGRDFLSFIHQEEQEEMVHFFSALGQWVGNSVARKIRIRHRDGTFRVIFGTIDNLLDNPILQGRVINFKDVTEQHFLEERLRESEMKYRSYVELAQYGLWAVDEEGYTSFANRRMAEILGYTVEEMIGRCLLDFTDGSWAAQSARFIDQPRQGICEYFDFEFIRKDGSRAYTIVGTNPLIDDNDLYQGALVAVTDITWKKKAEEEEGKR